MDLLRNEAEALANQEPGLFMEGFDRDMPGFAKLQEQIERLAAEEVASSVEVVRDEGDGRARSMELDWLLKIGREQPRRAILKCRVEKRGRKWKITSLEPIEFFK
jgi:hypothetical protein